MTSNSSRFDSVEIMTISGINHEHVASVYPSIMDPDTGDLVLHQSKLLHYKLGNTAASKTI